MTSIDLANVALRAKGLDPGPVTPEEVEFAREILRQRENGIIDAIHVLGLCGTVTDASLLETYLHGEKNNLYAEYALKALCRYLALTDKYRPLLRAWVQEKSDSFRRMAAIHLAKEYFRDYHDNELGCYLVSVLCDMKDDCRGAVRYAFVEIFDLRAKLDDPFGLNFDDWDEDLTLIVSVAATEFGMKELKISIGDLAH
ncbi:hypothetical protein [Mycoplana sp. MJR14]|uniref:hypothetical protein n=1 Tax=Mycoplana sp. MJR14 TaxID=3032583 RepID=UPI0023DBF56C|nr:hypothetical protein [Mycoplana sp. MJR14]MDF1631487.1 hypothetical protein [Mycoplana sp. MJR14]